MKNHINLAFYTLFFLLSMGLISGCKIQSKTSNSSSKLLQNHGSSDEFIINNRAYSFPDISIKKFNDSSFAPSPFKTIPTEKNLTKIYGRRLKVTKNIASNRHTGFNDTLVTCRSKKDFYQFYKGQHNTFIQHAIVKSNHIKLSCNIYIGITKTEIRKYIKSLPKEFPDIIDVSNKEKSDYVRLYFRKDKLYKLVWIPYLD